MVGIYFFDGLTNLSLGNRSREFCPKSGLQTCSGMTLERASKPTTHIICCYIPSAQDMFSIIECRLIGLATMDISLHHKGRWSNYSDNCRQVHRSCTRGIGHSLTLFVDLDRRRAWLNSL